MKNQLIVFCLTVLLLTGCATDPYTGESKVSKTAIGSGIGALAGAGIGAIAGGGRGALIGAGIGAVGGAAVGGYMDLQARALRQELQGTGVQIFQNGDQIHLIMPGNITFDTDSAQIKPSFQPVLDSIAKVLNEYDQTRVSIVGYTDNTGTVAYNNALSLKRARAVETYLRIQKVNYERLVVSGMGPQNPIASNAKPEGREQNRRVEMTLINQSGQ